ncbi:retrovirus-related pol polyprotein from transposon TNT 1-94 [Tanacetum coccineum]
MMREWMARQTEANERMKNHVTQGLTKKKVFEKYVLANHVGDEELKSIDGVGTRRMTKNEKDDKGNGGLAKDGLARGILTSVLLTSKKSSHQPKAEDTNQEKLYLLHMDLCGPMRVESISGKKLKDEAPDDIIKCIKNIQVCLNATVRNVRTDNGTKFVNQNLREFYENVGISHQTSVARTPQQNGVVER